MATFNAYLLDPGAATIRPVAIDRKDILAALYKIIGCEAVDRVWLDDIHVAYCDDEGMMRPATGLWTVKGHDAPPVAGRAIVTADDGQGGDKAPVVTMRKIADSFKIFRAIIVPELVEFAPVNPGELGGAIVHATRLGSLKLQLESPDITIGAAR